MGGKRSTIIFQTLTLSIEALLQPIQHKLLYQEIPTFANGIQTAQNNGELVTTTLEHVERLLGSVLKEHILVKRPKAEAP